MAIASPLSLIPPVSSTMVAPALPSIIEAEFNIKGKKVPLVGLYDGASLES